jgi:F-type H+-transporting ATPase subunit b
VPQFNFATYSSQIFWLLVCFGVFFAYIKFYFLPRLEGVLIKRNQDMAEMQKEIQRNNIEAKENFEKAEQSIRQAHKLADSIIAAAENEARVHEAQIIAEARQIQQDAIEKMIAKQRDLLLGKAFDDAVRESVVIVLQNIGMEINDAEIDEIIQKMRSKH